MTRAVWRRPFARAGAWWAWWVVAAGCSTKPLQPDAGGGGSAGTGSIGVDAAQDHGSAIDGPSPSSDATFDAISPPPPLDGAIDVPRLDGGWDGPADGIGTFSGRRSFVVTSRLQTAQDGGASMIPASHVFTLIADGDQGLAIAGANGQGSSARLQGGPNGQLATAGTLVLALPVGCSGSVVYSSLVFTIDGSGGLTGSGRGQASVAVGDVALPIDVSMSLTGVPDHEAPQLTFVTTGDMSDPLNTFAVASSEPLPPYGGPYLLATGGETVPLSAAPPPPAAFATQFGKPAQMLRYATGYRLVTEPVQDFASNAAAPGPSFTTAALPPLVVEDGFESLSTATYGGAQVLSAPDPTITGARSLYIAPSANPVSSRQAVLTVRLARAPGDTVVRFSYRTVNPGSFGHSFLLGSEGGSITGAGLGSDNMQTATSATIGTTAVSLGPVMTATFPIPGDVVDTVVLQRTTPGSYCGGRPLPPVPGMIIDDLRTE